MYNSEEIQNDTNRAFNENNEELGGNLHPESNNQFEEEQSPNQFQQSFPIGQNLQSPDDNSFHLDKKIDDFSRADKFIEKEKSVSQQLEKILREKSGYTMSTFTKHMFMINKILLLTTFCEFLFQRFDAVTLFLCIAILFLELEIFSQKHLYKWLIVLLGSILLDALVLIDVSPVSKINCNIEFYFNYINRQEMLIWNQEQEVLCLNLDYYLFLPICA